MNREFYLPDISPAAARKLLAAIPAFRYEGQTEALASIAARDRLTGGDSDTLELRQFILDHDFRCVIPHDDNTFLIHRALRDVIPRDEEVWEIAHNEAAGALGEAIAFPNLSSAEALTKRHCIVIAHMNCDDLDYDWLGRIFPRLIIVMTRARQMSFLLGGRNLSGPHAAASILFPSIVKAIRGDYNLVRDSRAKLAMIGAFAGLMKESGDKTTLRDAMMSRTK